MLSESFYRTRLSTTFDEVKVYPIPAALYLVKNLLQVSFPSCLLVISTSREDKLLSEILLYVFCVLCGSITFSLMSMPRAIRY